MVSETSHFYISKVCSKRFGSCAIKASVGQHSRLICRPTFGRYVDWQLADVSADTHVGRHPPIFHSYSADTLPTLGQHYAHFVSSCYWVYFTFISKCVRPYNCIVISGLFLTFANCSYNILSKYILSEKTISKLRWPTRDMLQMK